ncbi:hypothetical protein BB559_004125 [Furculomyces boomerangus]|uniref:CNH domain-containing protein n=1 Tax=Furculomyces boomerangus TaxID=61424 RepID=A0A2T9YGH4_9FUNG|nr:hypothetical protein BB559_004125 [Furculomyces boomerangus]
MNRQQTNKHYEDFSISYNNPKNRPNTSGYVQPTNTNVYHQNLQPQPNYHYPNKHPSNTNYPPNDVHSQQFQPQNHNLRKIQSSDLYPSQNHPENIPDYQKIMPSDYQRQNLNPNATRRPRDLENLREMSIRNNIPSESAYYKNATQNRTPSTVAGINPQPTGYRQQKYREPGENIYKSNSLGEYRSYMKNSNDLHYQEKQSPYYDNRTTSPNFDHTQTQKPQYGNQPHKQNQGTSNGFNKDEEYPPYEYNNTNTFSNQPINSQHPHQQYDRQYTGYRAGTRPYQSSQLPENPEQGRYRTPQTQATGLYNDDATTQIPPSQYRKQKYQENFVHDNYLWNNKTLAHDSPEIYPNNDYKMKRLNNVWGTDSNEQSVEENQLSDDSFEDQNHQKISGDTVQGKNYTNSFNTNNNDIYDRYNRVETTRDNTTNFTPIKYLSKQSNIQSEIPKSPKSYENSSHFPNHKTDVNSINSEYFRSNKSLESSCPDRPRRQLPKLPAIKGKNKSEYSVQNDKQGNSYKNENVTKYTENKSSPYQGNGSAGYNMEHKMEVPFNSFGISISDRYGQGKSSLKYKNSVIVHELKENDPNHMATQQRQNLHWNQENSDHENQINQRNYSDPQINSNYETRSEDEDSTNSDYDTHQESVHTKKYPESIKEGINHNNSLKLLPTAKSTYFNKDQMLAKEALVLETQLQHMKVSRDSLKVSNLKLKAIQDIIGNGYKEADIYEGKTVDIESLECYSPTCSKDSPCYSPTCSHNTVDLKSTLLLKSEAKKPQKLWIQGVPKEISEKLPKQEITRQELIYEVVQTEREYVSDLLVLQQVFRNGLLVKNIIPQTKLKLFVEAVFKNLDELISANSKILEELERRHNLSYVCEKIGDIFLNNISSLDCYVEYGANQPFSKYVLDGELQTNKALFNYIKEAERNPLCRKLPIQSFLGRPSSRLARYPLLFEAILKRTPEGHPDRNDLRECVEGIRKILAVINVETGKLSNKLKLITINQKLLCSVAHKNDLDLLNEKRNMVRTGVLRKKPGVGEEIQAMLLDHMLIFCKERKIQNEQSELILLHPPIPLLLLTLSYTSSEFEKAKPPISMSRSTGTNDSNFVNSAGGSNSFANNSGFPAAQQPQITPAPLSGDVVKYTDSGDKGKTGFSMTITHLGRHGGTYVLYASSVAERSDWIQNIEQQQKLNLSETKQIFEVVKIAPPFPISKKVNCATFFDEGKCILLGTDNGLVAGFVGKMNSFIKLKCIDHDRIVQVEILEKHGCLLLLCDKDRNVVSYPLDVITGYMGLKKIDNNNKTARGEKLGTHVNFFKFGACMNLDILCIVKNNSLRSQSIINIFRPSRLQVTPVSSDMLGHRTAGHKLAKLVKPINKKLHNFWKVYRDCYIAAESFSIFFLQSKLCIGCDRGFEIVDLSSMLTQSLLDPADQSLSFVHRKRDNSIYVPTISRESLSPANIKGGSGNTMNLSVNTAPGYMRTSNAGNTSPSFYSTSANTMPTASSASVMGIGGGASGSITGSELQKNTTKQIDETINPIRPISLFRVQNGEFLLCYSDFGFFVNRHGQRARKQFIIHWESNPTNFVYLYPYIMAIDNSFIEIRNIETSELVQIMSFGSNITYLSNLYSTNANGIALVGCENKMVLEPNNAVQSSSVLGGGYGAGFQQNDFSLPINMMGAGITTSQSVTNKV